VVLSKKKIQHRDFVNKLNKIKLKSNQLIKTRNYNKIKPQPKTKNYFKKETAVPVIEKNTNRTNPVFSNHRFTNKLRNNL